MTEYRFENGTPYREPSSVDDRAAAVKYVRRVLDIREAADKDVAAFFREYDDDDQRTPYDPENAEHVAQARARYDERMREDARELTYIEFQHPRVKELAATLLSRLALDDLA